MKDELIIDGEVITENHEDYHFYAWVCVSDWLLQDEDQRCINPWVLLPNAPKWAHVAYADEMERRKEGIKT